MNLLAKTFELYNKCGAVLSPYFCKESKLREYKDNPIKQLCYM